MLARAILAVTVLAALGCEGMATIPPGAQQVHISATESTLRIQPAVVQPGDIYVVLDGPQQSVVFVARHRTADSTPGPMSAADLDRVALGDTEGTSMEGLSVGCSEEQRTRSRGKIGHCGNVYKLVLGAGSYAFLTDSPDRDPPRPVADGSMAVLEVTR
jgi:hypothetical protein